MRKEQKGAETDLFCQRRESVLENGAQFMEVWETDFHLKPGKVFLSGKAIQQKGLLWAGTSPSTISISKVSWELRDGDVIEGVLGLNAGVGMVLSEVSVRHESL